jgi:MFS transporter, YNFM family, putative membrane transport protein
MNTSTSAEHSMMLRRSVIIGTIGFLTLVDLFATQAILPSLAKRYDVPPSMIGFAVNAGTIGMAASCLIVSLLSAHINRWRGIWISLALLAIPTALLSIAPNLGVFAALRIAQGVFMAAAFTLSMAYLAEHLSPEGTAKALAAYITGVVASNLVGRLVSATIADLAGLGFNFYLFAALNLAGAALVFVSFESMSEMASTNKMLSPLADWAQNLRNPAIRSCFTIGFLILFAFIGIFTYVNFVLSGEPVNLSRMSLGLVYFVFLPSMVTTPLAGKLALRVGTRPAIWIGLAVAGIGLPLLLQSNLTSVLAGMTLVGVGTFLAQAICTGFVGRSAMGDRAAASGLYLAFYYLGGLTGAAVVGQIFDRVGWPACVITVAIAIALCAVFALKLKAPATP